MKAADVKCLYCGERFNRNDLNIPTKQVSARRYAHLSCWEKHQSEMSKEERDMEAFFEYVRNLFKEDYNHILTKKLAERYVKEGRYMDKDLTTTGKGLVQTEDSEYVRLVSLISGVWGKAKENAALSVNSELLDAS